MHWNNSLWCNTSSQKTRELTYDNFGQVVDEFAVVQHSVLQQMSLKHCIYCIRTNQRTDLAQGTFTSLHITHNLGN